MATDGAFKKEFSAMTLPLSYRKEIRRFMYFSPFFDWILNFWMGPSIDSPITAWQEMFLPAMVGQRLGEFRYRDASGTERKLVSHVEVRNRARGRPPILKMPRAQWKYELGAGLFIAILLVFLLYFRDKDPYGTRYRAVSITWAVVAGLLGLFFGGCTVPLLFMEFFTNHDYTWNNLNILYANPILLAGPVFAVRYIRAWCGRYYDPEKRARMCRYTCLLWTYVLAVGLFVALLHVFPFIRQQNQVTLCLMMPFAAVLSVIPAAIVYIRREYLWRWGK
jgi:uncharacterized integral membrane protein